MAGARSTASVVIDEEDQNSIVNEVTVETATRLELEANEATATKIGIHGRGLAADELFRMRERQVWHLTPEEDEMLDPIERTVRYVVPIPAQYYWDVVAQSDRWAEIPTSIKVWHTTIASCAAFNSWTNNRIAQPLASFLGLTGPRFFEVLDGMTAAEMDQSARRMRARRSRDQESRLQHTVDHAP